MPYRTALPSMRPKCNLGSARSCTILLSYTLHGYFRTIPNSPARLVQPGQIACAPVARTVDLPGPVAAISYSGHSKPSETSEIMTDTGSRTAPRASDDAQDTEQIRVLIALAVPLLRAGVRQTVREQDDMRVVGEVSDLDRVIPSVVELAPDIVILDTDFQRQVPGFVQKVRDCRPATAVLVMVNHSDEECVIRSMLASPDGPQFSDDAVAKLSECCLMALRSSARGCIPKVADPDRLVGAIRTVSAGGLAAGAWLGSMVGRLSDAPPSEGRVTGRELDIISLVARGMENKEIAAELEIAEQTVKNHLSRVMKKLGLRNRQEVAMFAVRVHLDPPK